MRHRFVTEETALFSRWKVFPDMDSSMDSLYLGEMEISVDEAYEVGIAFIGER